MHTVALSAEVRKTLGKGAARSLRSQSLVPAVLYGRDIESTLLSVSPGDLEKATSTASAENILIDLTITDGQSTRNQRAMIREIQVDPVKRTILHVDFLGISMDRQITVEAPINLVGDPIGVAAGGMLQQVVRSVEISCLPDRIPDTLELDVSSLTMGHSLHVSDLRVPDGVELLSDPRLTIATVLAPKRMEEKPAAPAEGEELAEAAPETEETEE
ncbi:MAG TPA: 50S ribosomal protein L25/general stress protein Ctc [Syntrophobacteria bacterium]|nr:50S ribosomal protein L25/general stress protein Ctc [Syntrophobacteria bacterium]